MCGCGSIIFNDMEKKAELLEDLWGSCLRLEVHRESTFLFRSTFSPALQRKFQYHPNASFVSVFHQPDRDERMATMMAQEARNAAKADADDERDIAQ